MPPTFLYLLAFGVWLCMAASVWTIAFVLLLLPITRRWAGPLAAAMAGTFPGVLLAQIVTLPVAAALLGAALLAIHLIEPGNGGTTTNPTVIALGFALVAAELVLLGAMSLLGFFEGWRAGWLWARGHRFAQVLGNGPTSQAFGGFRKRH